MALSQPVPARRLRASDQERHDAILALSEHHAEGRLDLPEFTVRMERAQEATYIDELYPLFADLPLRRTGTANTGPGRPRRSHRPELAWLLPVMLAAVVAMSIITVLSFHFFPVWLLVGFWFFWVRGARRNRMRWQHWRPGQESQDWNRPAAMPSSPPPRPW